jgi:methyl-accepting chemotaxis protein
MGRKEIKTIKKQLMLNFIILLLLNPVINILILSMRITSITELKGVIIIILMELVICSFSIIPFSFITTKLQKLIDGQVYDDASIRFAGSLPVKVSLLFCVPILIGPMMFSFIGFYEGLIVSPYQLVFYFIKDILLALSLTLFHYYRFKTILYPVSSANNLRSLSMFEKLIAPILSFMIVILLFVGFSIYSINVDRTMEFYKAGTIAQSDKTALILDSTFNNVSTELKSYMNTYTPDRISQTEGYAVTKKLYDNRINKSIESLFFAKNDGITFSNRQKTINVGDRPYFKEMAQNKKQAWSDLVLSRDTGNLVIVCAVPNITGGVVNGAVGATISVEDLKIAVNSASTTDDTKFFIMNRDGKIIYHPENRLLDKVLGKDLLDKNGKDLTDFVKGTDTEFRKYVINNKPLMLRKIQLQSTGHFLVSTSYESFLMKPVNSIVIRVIIGMLLINVFVFILLYKTGKNFSTPIRNTIKIFRKLSGGDLTARSSDFLADEFGDMIRNMKKFQDKIRGVVDAALNASTQLAASSEELASTSSSLADGAQSQAAAVEEATASLEEISASNESIADNSREQSDYSKNTFKAMEELGSIINSVNADAVSALQVANVTHSEASKGNVLMQNTIKGMNSIEENSMKIAEMVTLISDISDKVNLLSLNAAIEAARAGENGRGFAVVADEISKLADQTAESAKSITVLVSNGVKSAKQGITDINETSGAMEAIIIHINKTKELVQKIADSSERQALSSEEVQRATKQVMTMSDSISNSTREQTFTHTEISKTMDQINEQTQAQASGAEEIASSAEQISAQAENMKNLLDFFKTH